MDGHREGSKTTEMLTGEAASAREIVNAMVRGARSLTIYPEGSPFHSRFIEEMHRKAAVHLEAWGSLRLDLKHHEITVKGVAVYENLNPRESIAFRLHADGVRFVEFHPGITAQELRTFLTTVNSCRSSLSDDDIATLLWANPMPHVSYELEEELDEAGINLAGHGGESSRQRAGIEKACSEAALAKDVSLPAAEFVDIFRLDEAEEGFLEKAIRYEMTLTPLRDLVGILSALLVTGVDPLLRAELLDLTAGIAAGLVAGGRLDEGVEMLRVIGRESAREELQDWQRGEAAQILAGVARRPVMENPERFVSAAGTYDCAPLRDLGLLLGPEANGLFVLLLGAELTGEAEAAVVDLLSAAVRDGLCGAGDLLVATDPRAASRALAVLKGAGAPAPPERIAALMAEGGDAVQKEALSYLETVAVRGGERILLGLLEDGRESIRMRTLRALVKGGYRAAARGLRERALSGSFRERSFSERKAVFEAIGFLGGDEAVPFLRKTLLSRSVLSFRKGRDAEFCAAAGLAAVGSPLALRALKEADATERRGLRGLFSRGSAEIDPAACLRGV